MALNTVSSDRLSTNVKNTNFTEAEKQDLTDDIKPLLGSSGGGNKNLIINGAMNVAQRGTSSTGLGTSAGYFTLDRYRTTFSNTAGRVTMEQVADVHDGFANAMKFSCTTADTSIGSNEYFILQQKIEGQNLQQLKKGSSDAEQFTVSFYVKGNASATYVVEIYDLDNNRQISKTFSVTTNWTRVELTFPADTTGAFDDDNNASLQLGIWLHAGSTYTSGTLNSSAFAAVTSANRAVGISSIFDSTARTFFITGVQLEVGNVATEFDHRSFGQELELCQRYYQKSYDYSTTPGTATTIGSISNTAYAAINYAGNSVQLPVRMRTTPTVTLYSTTTGATGKINADSGVGTGQATYIGEKNFFAHRQDDGTGVGANVYIRFQFQAVAEL
tara:strand:- start:527 stop:1687 length:1161 start_codon:yes stop_codon:yes gene_type:complete